jgi:hypothetical protein
MHKTLALLYVRHNLDDDAMTVFEINGIHGMK